MAYVVEYIKGDAILNRKWNIGDAIIYNSDPEDIEHEHLHLRQGIIGNIYKDNARDDHIILIQFPYGTIKTPLRKISVQIKPDIGCRTFFVYGTLCSTKQWISNCKSQDGRLYKYRLYKERSTNYPFAIHTNNKFDYVNGRLITFADINIFEHKLAIADRVEGYAQYGGCHRYGRSIADVMDEDGIMMKALVYYRKFNRWQELGHCQEIPDGDWRKRDWIQSDDEKDAQRFSRKDTNLLKQKLRNMLRKIRKAQNSLIDSLPLPQEDKDDIEWFSVSGDDIALMNEHKTVQKFRTKSVHSVFGNVLIKSNTDYIYHWRFKIDEGGNGLLIIGICSFSSNMMRLVNKPFYTDEHCENYGYNVFNGYKISQNVYRKYGAKSTTNDVVGMELNMKQRTLSFYINGECQDIAFHDIPKSDEIRYQMTLSLQQHQNRVTLETFKITKQ